MNPTLAEIREQQYQFELMLKEFQDSIDGELTDDQNATLQAIFECKTESEAEEEAKIQRIINLVSDWEFWAKRRKEEAKRLKELAQADENNASRVRDLLLSHLKTKGIKNYRTLTNNVAVCRNGGKTPVKLKEGFSPLDLPQKFQRIKTSVEADTDAIREQLESGQDLDFAYLEERGYHLRIS